MNSYVLMYRSHANMGKLFGMHPTFVPCVVYRANLDPNVSPNINLNGIMFAVEIPFQELTDHENKRLESILV